MNWLQKLRLDANYTQTEIADACGVSARQYQRWEARPDRLPLCEVSRLLAELDPDEDYALIASPFGWYLSRVVDLIENM